MTENHVLIIDDDPSTEAELRDALLDAGLSVEVTNDTAAAIEKLRANRYRAIVLDPVIRHRLNGFAVLSAIELDQPDLLDRVYLLTGMSKQTIARTAPALLPRLYRKPCEGSKLLAAMLVILEPRQTAEGSQDATTAHLEILPPSARLQDDVLLPEPAGERPAMI